MNRDLTHRSSQLGPSRIALHGDVLAQIVDDELRTWDAVTMQRQDAWSVTPRHICFLQDASLVAFSLRPGSTESALYRIGTSRNLETLRGPIFQASETSLVLPARSANAVYVTEVDDIVELELTGARAEEGSSMKHPAPNAGNRDQLFSRSDGRIVAPAHERGWTVVAPGKPDVVFATEHQPLHLVAASGERLWYSYATAASWNANMLALARVDRPREAVKLIDVVPGRIVHLASAGTSVAALVLTMRDKDSFGWSVVVADETGTVRWRAEVPAAFDPHGALTSGFVAISERRVVLAGHDHALLAWDAATGTPVD